MLILKNITKDYAAGDSAVHALRGVSLAFRESEFVAVLGPSGCGKTTLLNIIGGLDQYTDGDLVINGRSTKLFKDKDWDTYRNHSIGFVFQSYNLIPHQSVLANVELALTISGVSRAERRERAVRVLEQVGLADQVSKRPNQLSGGQMQRVAIARALINDPDILLADEPTGALDSETSVQVMDILKEVAKTRLVVMVTHNAELAEEYATRIVRLLDGKVTSDSNPLTVSRKSMAKKEDDDKKSPSMTFGTAFVLSMKNLMTKRARTILTAFAGSIGIIGIALILSLSNGIQNYIDQVQEDTLSSYPLTIEATSVDLSSLVSSISGTHGTAGEVSHGDDAVYSSVVLYDLLNSLTSADTQTNDLVSLKEYLEEPDCPILEYASSIQYTYDAKFDIYTKDEDGDIVSTDVVQLLQDLMTQLYGGDYSSYFSSMGSYYSNFEVWEEMLAGENGQLVSNTLQDQYDIVYGTWPTKYDEVVLFMDSNNEISDLVLYALGLKTESEIVDYMQSAMAKQQVDATGESWSYEELCGHTFQLILASECYQYDAVSGTYKDISKTSAGLDFLYNDEAVGTELKIVGIARPNGDSVGGMMKGSIGYTSALTDHIISASADTDIMKAQLDEPDTDVITGLPFYTGEEAQMTSEELAEAVSEYIASLSNADKASVYTSLMCTPPDGYAELMAQQTMSGMTREYIEEMLMSSYTAQMGTESDTVREYISNMDDDTLYSYVQGIIEEQVTQQYSDGMAAQLASLSVDDLAAALDAAVLIDWQNEYIKDNFMPATVSDSTYTERLDELGYVDKSSPDTINIYVATFADKDSIAAAIDDYNASHDEAQEITYTDYVALLMSSITTIIRAISYVLIAFVAISLVVSSIMIGIITYISVLERTKEIGILRAIGASKRDVSNVFNAETIIEGFAAGLIGIGLTLVLIIPINALVHHLTGIATLSAVLPLGGAIILILISVLLTFVAGLIPSRIAAKRDPVEALRTD